MKRLLTVLLLISAGAASPAAPASEFVQAVEFPYHLFPRALWERELVWLKSIGIRTVEFSVPWEWHTTPAGDFDFDGRTSPRRDLAGLIRILRKLEMQAWVRGTGGVSNGPRPPWRKQLEQLLASQTVSHGGPVAYVDGGLTLDAAAPPGPITPISASDPDALATSRAALAAGWRTLRWTDVEDALYPEGWAAAPGTFLRKGAVGLSGDEHASVAALRRNAALLRSWAALLPGMQPVAMPKPAAGKLPDGVAAAELIGGPASAVSITNRSDQPFHDELRVVDPASKRTLVIPSVTVGAGESLWLPLGVSIGREGLCKECSHFSGAEHIVYATAELLSIEFENGILAMEFAAPEAGEAILQLARQPVGPYLAAGKPTEFDWDDKTLRARLPIPASRAADHRVRIGIAIEEPDTSAFFNDTRRLVIGQKNVVATTYSSADLEKRSRLLLPQGFTADRVVKSPNETNYEVTVPADAIHGDWVNLALEADGMLLGRARLQLFRPASVRWMQGIQLHFGSETELAVDPPTAPIDPKAGTNLDIAIRNNYPGIETFRLEASGDGLEFLPAKTEISVGATDERHVSVRVFAKDGVAGLRDWRLRVSGGATQDLPMRALLLPRGRTVAWSADLDGDGSTEWVLESQKARAIFSSQDGGRWMEFNWKDSNLNFLPEQGAMTGEGPVDVRAEGDALVFSGKGWKRTVRLVESTLTMEQSTALPADGLSGEKRGNVELTVERSAGRAVFTLR